MAKPILFNTPMTQAILDNRKTTTRRVIKPQPSREGKLTASEIGIPRVVDNDQGNMWTLSNPPYKIGDILYVRETGMIQSMKNIGKKVKMLFKADNSLVEFSVSDEEYERLSKWELIKRWLPPYWLTKETARIFLKVTDIRVERLKEMTLTDLIKEGMWIKGESIPANKFIDLWNSTINKQDLNSYGWEANPWVWVIEFERVEVE
ncbi:hypothetical protein CIW83_09460 [Tissierella sp. P1]|nr:hypothetical protein CIW83_09460 [Tissierella sp. P1]